MQCQTAPAMQHEGYRQQTARLRQCPLPWLSLTCSNTKMSCSCGILYFDTLQVRILAREEQHQEWAAQASQVSDGRVCSTYETQTIQSALHEASNSLRLIPFRTWLECFASRFLSSRPYQAGASRALSSGEMAARTYLTCVAQLLDETRGTQHNLDRDRTLSQRPAPVA